MGPHADGIGVAGWSVDLTVETLGGCQHGIRVESCDVEGLDGAKSATVTLVLGGQILIIGASNGMYYVTVMLRSGRFNRLGNLRSEEMVQFLVGGKSVDLPRRFVLTSEEAIEGAKEFALSGSIRVGNGWEQEE